jgi:hypothetical protein
MTYGWSILIIAVVLGALAYLGVFNPLYFAPKANSGSCQAFRPNGAGTSYDINLLGVCNGEIPQYTTEFIGTGDTSDIVTNLYFPSSNTMSFSAFAWIKPASSTPNCGYCGIIDADNGRNGWGLTYWSGGPMDFWILGQGYTQDMEFGSEPRNTWTFVGITDSCNNGVCYANGYINGVDVDPNVERAPVLEPIPFGITIGQSRESAGFNFNGLIANVQIYNTSLSANEVQALYQEGIGGAPIDLHNLVGWWPLNGNANDYSGNGNNGVPANVVYTSSWISSYNPP